MNRNIDINLPHHMKDDLCTSRPAYRQGRKLTSVKVYTVNRESQHLLIYNVPAINLVSEVHKLCDRFGEVTYCTQITTNEVEEFTSVFHVRFEKVHQARFAKRKMDDMSFFGGVLHVCYAPELESVEETKEKLSIRRKEVSFHLKKLAFPKLFTTPQRKGRLKRKVQNDPNHTYFHNLNYECANISREISDHQNGVPSSVPSISKENSTSFSIQPQLKPIDISSFKKLVPTQVSRIVFHNKTEKMK